MTAVLNATDALRNERMLSSVEDNYPSSSTDWRLKYIEVADMLAETRAELDEFHYSSKELEEELIRELERTEKAQQDLKVKVAKAESDRDEWKAKFMSLQTAHNTATTTLQRELDKLRQEHQLVKIQLRDLEMGNDDLERSEREVSSTLADLEAKYSRALEEKILLEQELLGKANLEEEAQRLKDELRDANMEISMLKKRLRPRVDSRSSDEHQMPASPPSLFNQAVAPLDEDLLNTTPPPDLQLSELSPSSEDLLCIMKVPKRSEIQSSNAQDANVQSRKSNVSAPNNMPPPSFTKFSNLPIQPSQSRVPSSRNPIARTPSSRNPLSTSSNATAIPVTASRNKGVQMVSEMRARVRNLEQKIHTRVPRLRMGSITGRSGANTVATLAVATGTSSSKALPKADDHGGRMSHRHSLDIEVEKRDKSGWVLVMEDSPPKPKHADRRRASSPIPQPGHASSAFKVPALPLSSAPPPSLTASKLNALAQSTSNANPSRPRLSTGSLGSTWTASSIPTPTSRSATPTATQLPLPSGLSASISTSSAKQGSSVAPSSYAYSKRSSLGSSTALLSSSTTLSNFGLPRSTSMQPPSFIPDRKNDNTRSSVSGRPKTSPSVAQPSNSSISSLSQSRIGRSSMSARSTPSNESLSDSNSAVGKDIRNRLSMPR